MDCGPWTVDRGLWTWPFVLRPSSLLHAPRLVPQNQGSPEWAFDGQADSCQFVERQTDQRRMEHGQDRHVLQRVVEQLKQAQQVGDFGALVESASGDLQRDIEPGEFLGVTFGFVGRRTQQHGHVAPGRRPETAGGLIPDGMPGGVELAQAQGDQAGLFLRLLEVAHLGEGLGGFVVFLEIAAVFEAEVQLDGWGRVGGGAQGAPFLGGAKAQLGPLIIVHPAQLAAHQQAEKRVDETQEALAAAEIVHQRDDLAARVVPGVHIALKNVGIGEPKPVDALFDVAHQEAVAQAPSRLSASMILSWAALISWYSSTNT